MRGRKIALAAGLPRVDIATMQRSLDLIDATALATEVMVKADELASSAELTPGDMPRIHAALAPFGDAVHTISLSEVTGHLKAEWEAVEKALLTALISPAAQSITDLATAAARFRARALPSDAYERAAALRRS